MSCPDARTRRLGLAAAAAAMALAVAGTAAAQSMVVRSTGPSASKYPTGTKLKSSEKVILVAGDRIVLIQGGKTRTLSGPGTYSSGGTVQASQTTGTTVARMLASGSQGRARGGFTRGDPGGPPPADIRAPNLWLLDYREGGTFCVADPATLMLWRPHMGSDELVKIEQGGKSETVAFVSGANYRKWPLDIMPVQYGVDYRLSGAGMTAPVTIRFAPLENLPEAADGAAEMLMAKGCKPQLDRLVDAMAESEAAGG
jgi:hypothetical protein